MATLENAINSLASLMVLELYMMKEITDSVNLSLNKPCEYFKSPYTSGILCTNEKTLHDFEGPRDKGVVKDETLSLNTLGGLK